MNNRIKSSHTCQHTFNHGRLPNGHAHPGQEDDENSQTIDRHLDESCNLRPEELADEIPFEFPIAFLEGDARAFGVVRVGGTAGTATAEPGSVLVPVVINYDRGAEHGHYKNVVDENNKGREYAEGLQARERRGERAQEGGASGPGRDPHREARATVHPAHPGL